MTGIGTIEKKRKTTVALSGRDIVCFSHDWTGDPLSKTHLMRILARDNRILWVNAIPNRMPTTSSKDVTRILNKVRAFADPVREVEPNIFVLNPFAIPAYGNKTVLDLNRRSLVAQVKVPERPIPRRLEPRDDLHFGPF